MFRRTEEECRPTVGLPSHINFVGFFNVPVQATTRDNIFTVIPRNRPISVAFHDAYEDTKNLPVFRS